MYSPTINHVANKALVTFCKYLEVMLPKISLEFYSTEPTEPGLLIPAKISFFKSIFWPLWLYWFDRKQDERQGLTSSKVTQAGSQTWVRCSEDKASEHGTPALPTELNGALAFWDQILQILYSDQVDWPAL